MTEKEITLISKEVKGIYLSYVSGSYGVYSQTGKSSKIPARSDPQTLYDNLLITDDYDDLDNDNKLLIGSINIKLNEVGTTTATEILMELMTDLYELFFNTNDKYEVKRIIAEMGLRDKVEFERKSFQLRKSGIYDECPTCGKVNKGKFCAECGTKKPEAALRYKCSQCGWEPEDPAHPPKFCPECGHPFNEEDIVK